MDAQVDASRPFSSVKEAVAIFGDRLFLREIQSSPKRPTSGLENETPYTSDHALSPRTPTNPSAEQDVGSTFDKPSEITLGPIEQDVKSPTYEVPPIPSNEEGVGSSLDQTSYSSENTVGPTEPLCHHDIVLILQMIGACQAAIITVSFSPASWVPFLDKAQVSQRIT